jgi:phospholipid/cholesterol/gamma-HCH transport system permease protein
MTAVPGRFTSNLDGDCLVIAASGAWILASAPELDADLQRLDPAGARTARIDLSHLDRLDTLGAWILHKMRARLVSAGLDAEFADVDPAHAALLERIATGETPTAPEREEPGRWLAFVEHVGRAASEIVQEAADLLSFLGLVTVTLGRSILHPSRIRLTSLVSHIEQVGINALPIIGLLSFLIGVVIAYQGADQLQRFGAEIFTVNLLAISILREMGILLAAIVIAGRSGSAFAAQIGTMQVNQEIDALEALGLDTVEILVLPRILALVIALPLLAVVADIMGLIGGGVMIMTVLDVSLVQFMEQLKNAVSVWSFWVGIVKAPVFAVLIALVGCREGLKVTGSAESVGRQTTKAVVVAIFLVIVTNAAFSILFSVLRM